MRGSVLATILLPVGVVVGYALVTAIGLAWPEHPWFAIGSSIGVSILLLLAGMAWLRQRTRWWYWVCTSLFAGALVFPMVGTASLGTDLALEQRAEQVSGEVSDIDVETVSHRRGNESYRTTYTFVSTDDGHELGTVEYRGGRDAYGLDIGDRTELLVDPSGDLPVELADEVDSGDDVTMIALGGVLFLLVYALGLVWSMVRRVSRGLDWS